MGLDIYSGKLTRYYSRNWKNNVQQVAEENNLNCVMRNEYGVISPIEDKAQIEEIREAIINWVEGMTTALRNADDTLSLPTPLWDESTECDYYTDKPDWEAFGALVMLKACMLLNRPVPKYVKSGWIVFEDPVIKEAMSNEPFCSLLSEVALWLPLQEKAIFVAPYPTGNEGRISTVSLLKQELEDLNRQLWNADETTILSWRNEKYYFPVKSKVPALFKRVIIPANMTRHEKYFTEDLAKCAYSMLYQAVRFAEEYHVPILLDY